MNMRAFITRTLIVALACCCFSFAPAQSDTAAISSMLVRSVDDIGKEFVFVLAKDGKIVYKKEAGSFNLKTQLPIGAASQWLTTALVLIYVQDGTISLNDKVSDYLPIFSKHGKGYITIGHCLTYNTGIQSKEGVEKIFQKNKYHTLEEEVNDYASKGEIGTNPGTEFRYSNMGFNIAARVLEVATKKTFDRLAQEKLFRPMTMRNTTFANEDYNDAISAAYGARSSAADYANFLSMLLNKGTFNGKQYLNEESIKQMFTIFETAANIKNAPKDVQGLDYAIGGWVLETGADRTPTAIACPSLTGTWPIIDLCRRYGFLLFTKPLSGDQHKNVAIRLKSAIDEQLGAGCN